MFGISRAASVQIRSLIDTIQLATMPSRKRSPLPVPRDDAHEGKTGTKCRHIIANC